MIARAMAMWLLLLALAFANGTVRQLLLIPRIGEQAGHVLSTLVLSALILVVASLCISWVAPATVGDAWRIGLLWAGMTLCFEFLAGRFAFHRTWEMIFADYDLFHGRIWVLVPIVTVIAPVLAFRGRTIAG